MKNVCKANCGLKCDYRRRNDKVGYNECTYINDCPDKITGKTKVQEIKSALEVEEAI